MPVRRSISGTTLATMKPSSVCSVTVISRPRSTSTAAWSPRRRMRRSARSSVNTSSSRKMPEGATVMSTQQIESSEQATVRSLPIEFWPEADRKAWVAACQPSQRLKRGGAASHMKVITRDDLARRYGYFLDCMNRRGLLDLNKVAGAHVTSEYVETYLAELNSRVGSVTAYGSIYKLRRACELIDPARDLSWLADIEKDLALVMRARSKSNRWVLTEVLVEAGLTLITEAENSRKMTKLGPARQVQDRLMVAILAKHAIRLPT